MISDILQTVSHFAVKIGEGPIVGEKEKDSEQDSATFVLFHLFIQSYHMKEPGTLFYI